MDINKKEVLILHTREALALQPQSNNTTAQINTYIPYYRPTTYSVLFPYNSLFHNEQRTTRVSIWYQISHKQSKQTFIDITRTHTSPQSSCNIPNRSRSIGVRYARCGKGSVIVGVNEDRVCISSIMGYHLFLSSHKQKRTKTCAPHPSSWSSSLSAPCTFVPIISGDGAPTKIGQTCTE